MSLVFFRSAIRQPAVRKLFTLPPLVSSTATKKATFNLFGGSSSAASPVAIAGAQQSTLGQPDAAALGYKVKNLEKKVKSRGKRKHRWILAYVHLVWSPKLDFTLGGFLSSLLEAVFVFIFGVEISQSKFEAQKLNIHKCIALTYDSWHCCSSTKDWCENGFTDRILRDSGGRHLTKIATG